MQAQSKRCCGTWIVLRKKQKLFSREPPASVCSHALAGGSRLNEGVNSAQLERAHIGPAAVGLFPSFVENVAREAVLGGQSRAGVHAFGERRVERAFVAANLAVSVEAACFDLGRAGFQNVAAVAFAVADR